jgi:hypothetical protein
MTTKRLWPAIVLFALVACDKHSTLPTTPTAPTTSTAGTASISSLEVIGPGTMAPGQSAQFTVIAHMSDSTSVEPTGVRWISSPPSMVQVDQSGRATAVSMGGAAVAVEIKVAGARNGVVTASRSVIVLEEGTYLMVGTVSDAEFSSAPLPGALVEVAGADSATTNSDGFYHVYGVSPGAEVRVSAAGYQPLVQTVGSPSNGRQDFRLTLAAPRLVLSGAYTMSIDATSGCANFPAELQHRRYDAVVTQNGLLVDVTLTAPRFQLTDGRGNHFKGRIDGSVVTFTLEGFTEGWDWNVPNTFPEVAEKLPNGTLLIPSGFVVATGSSDEIAGTLTGALTNMDATFPGYPNQPASCGGTHRFALTRR